MEPFSQHYLASLIILSLLILIIPQLRSIFFPVYIPFDKPTHERIRFFDVVKGVCIILVVYIHVVLWPYVYEEYTTLKPFAIFTNNLVRFVVPLFFLCTGILLQYKTTAGDTWRSFYGNKIIRIIIPYLLVCIFIQLLSGTPINVSEFMYKVVTGSLLSPYYFVIILIELYLLYPVLSLFKERSGFLPVLFVISFLSLFFVQLRYFYDLPLFLPYLYIFGYGMVIRTQILQKQLQEHVKAGVFIVLVYIVYSIVFIDYYFNANAIYAIAVFYLFYTIYHQLKLSHAMVWFLEQSGRLSLWIYLLHYPFVFYVFNELIHITSNLYINLFLVYVMSLMVSITAAAICFYIYQSYITFVTKMVTPRKF